MSAHDRISDVAHNQSVMASRVDAEFLKVLNETSDLWSEVGHLTDGIDNVRRGTMLVDRKAHDLHERVITLVERVNTVELKLAAQQAEAEEFGGSFARHKGLVITSFMVVFGLLLAALYVSRGGGFLLLYNVYCIMKLCTIFRKCSGYRSWLLS